jgi:cytochrome oxidase Cu insertion factor (SCO1/SenC/PrrC family)
LRPQGGRPKETLFSMFRAISGPSIALGLCLLAFGPTVGSAARQANTAQTVDVDTVGPKIGETLPEFSLRDQGGQVHSLKSLLGSKGAIIVFFRSADW